MHFFLQDYYFILFVFYFLTFSCILHWCRKSSSLSLWAIREGQRFAFFKISSSVIIIIIIS